MLQYEATDCSATVHELRVPPKMQTDRHWHEMIDANPFIIHLYGYITMGEFPHVRGT